MMLRQARLDMGYGLVDLMDAARDSAEHVRLPYLMLHGLGDRIMPQEPVRAAIEVDAAARAIQARLLREGYHLLLRDKEGKIVAADVVGLDRRPRGGAALGRRRRPLAARACGALGLEAQPLGDHAQRTTTEAGAAHDAGHVAAGRHVVHLEHGVVGALAHGQGAALAASG